VRQEYYYFPRSVHLVTFGKIGTQNDSEPAIGIIDIWISYGAPGDIFGTVVIIVVITYGIIFDIIGTVK
jgi:hypothetical protein